MKKTTSRRAVHVTAATGVRRTALVVLLGGSLLLPGCSGENLAEGVAERAAEAAGGGEVDIDVGEGTARVEGEDGTFEFGGELPEGFPDDVPVPDDYTVISSMEGESERGSGFNVMLATNQPAAELAAEFEQRLADTGWEFSDERYPGGKYEDPAMGQWHFHVTRGDKQLVMMVGGEDDAETTVMYNFGTNSSG